MRLAIITLIILTPVVVTGCGPQLFLNQVYSDDHLVACPELAGSWISDVDQHSEDYFMEIRATTTERLIVHFRGVRFESNALEVHPFSLNDQWFWDSCLASGEDQDRAIGVEVVAHSLPGHILLKIDYDEESLSLSYINDEGIRKYLSNNPDSLGHIRSGGRTIITAETPEIQDFISIVALEYIPDPDAPGDMIYHPETVFEHWATFRRIPEIE